MIGRQGRGNLGFVQRKVAIMRNGFMAGCVVAVCLAAMPARAGFVFNYTVTPGDGLLAGKNIFQFYARNDQTGDQLGSKSLLAADIHFRPMGGTALTFDFRDVNGDLIPDANTSGSGMDEGSVGGTFMRFGTYDDWQEFFVRPVGNRSGGGNVPIVAYANVNDLNLVGFSLNKALDATQGLGRFYGAAVVPIGVDVNVFGQVAAEKGGPVGTGAGPVTDGDVDALLAAGDVPGAVLMSERSRGVEQGPFFPFNFVASAPEPATMGLMGVGGVVVLFRRRRR
jgi:hypothetical protein